MSSFEWMELQTLTNDIELSRSRLVEARKSGDRGRVTGLEEEITRAESRRLQLLAHISTNIVTIPEAKGKDGAGARQAPAPNTWFGGSVVGLAADRSGDHSSLHRQADDASAIQSEQSFAAAQAAPLVVSGPVRLRHPRVELGEHARRVRLPHPLVEEP